MKKYISLVIFAVILIIWLFISPKIAQVDKESQGIIDQNITEDPTTSLVEPHRASVEHRTTCYLATGNLTASGKVPKAGMVATSDRTIPFGTRIEIDGIEYVVEDRTNKRFMYFETPTIDIFWEGSRESCLEYGVKYKEVIFK